MPRQKIQAPRKNRKRGEMSVRTGLAELDMLDTLLEEGNDVLIFHPVKDFLAIAAGPDQAHLAQPAHVVRDRRFADSDGGGQGADVELGIEEGRQDTDAAGIAEGTEELGDVGSRMLAEDGGGGV